MGKLKQYVSPSQLSKFKKCQLLYKYIYVDNNDSPKGSIYSAYGSALHFVIADYYNHQKEYNGKKGNFDEKRLKSVFTQSFSEEKEKLNGYPSNIAESLEFVGLAKIIGYVKEFGYKVKPLHVEFPFEIKLRTIDTTIRGIIDLITKDGMIIDHKTAGMTWKRTWNRNTVDTLDSLTFYAMAYRKLFGKKEKGVGVHVIPRTNKFELHEIYSHRTEQDILYVMRMIQAMDAVEKKNIFIPNRTECGNCDIKQICNKLPIL